MTLGLLCEKEGEKEDEHLAQGRARIGSGRLCTPACSSDACMTASTQSLPLLAWRTQGISSAGALVREPLSIIRALAYGMTGYEYRQNSLFTDSPWLLGTWCTSNIAFLRSVSHLKSVCIPAVAIARLMLARHDQLQHRTVGSRCEREVYDVVTVAQDV